MHSRPWLADLLQDKKSAQNRLKKSRAPELQQPGVSGQVLYKAGEKAHSVEASFRKLFQPALNMNDPGAGLYPLLISLPYEVQPTVCLSIPYKNTHHDTSYYPVLGPDQSRICIGMDFCVILF